MDVYFYGNQYTGFLGYLDDSYHLRLVLKRDDTDFCDTQLDSGSIDKYLYHVGRQIVLPESKRQSVVCHTIELLDSTQEL